MKSKPFVEQDYWVQVKFYDIDIMNIVWHGHYMKYMEEARSQLMQKIGYDYEEMRAENIAWPIVKLDIKYITPLILKQNIRIQTSLIEYENRIVIHYAFYDLEGNICTKASTVQMAVHSITKETLFTSSPTLIEKVQRLISNENI